MPNTVYGIGGLVSVPPGPLTGNGVPSANFRGQLGQQYFDNSTSPPTMYVYNGSTWVTGGDNPATTTTYGSVILTDNSEPVATKAYADALAIAGAPVSTTTTAGIGELATDVQAIAGTASTGALALFVTPSNLSPVFASPPAIGGTVAAAATFTGLTADGTGVVTLASSADATISTATGSFVVSAGESAADAVKIESTAGGVEILASGASAGEDIVLTATGSSIRLTSTESAVDSINVESTTGGIKILASGASAGEDIVVTATGSSIRLTATESATDSINIESTLGGVNILASGASAGEDINITATGSSVNVNSTENAAQAIYLHANGGTSETVQMHADQGTGDTSVYCLSDVGGVTLSGGKAAATAINITASDTAGGITMTAGTGGLLPTTTGPVTITSTYNNAGNMYLHANGGTSEVIKIHADQGTGVASINVLSDVGGITINGGKTAATAINLTATGVGGGMTLASGTGGVTLTNTGVLSLAGSGASNITVATGDLSIIDTASSVIVTAGEGVVDAIQLNALTAGGGIDINASSGGITMDTTAAISLDSATASNFTVTGAADLTLNSTAGAVNVTSGEANADSINVTSAGGMNIVATGAAGKDTIITNTSGSITITAGESASDAFNLTASGAASRMTLTAGTAGIKFASGVIVNVTSVAAAVSPYALDGTDYLITTDTTGGVLTITLPASPVTGRAIVIYDGVGQAAANNVTIDGNGKNIAFAGAAAGTKVLNTAYESATLYYNGTLWLAQDVV